MRASLISPRVTRSQWQMMVPYAGCVGALIPLAFVITAAACYSLRESVKGAPSPLLLH